MLPSLPGLPLGTIPPIPSAAPGAMDSAVPLPSGTLPTTGTAGGATGLSSLLGLAGSLVSPVTQSQSTTATAAPLTDITPDSFVAKVAYLVLGIVFIGGAIYTYVK